SHTGDNVAPNAKHNHTPSRDFSRDTALNSYTGATYTLDNSSHRSATRFSLANWQDANRLCAVHYALRQSPNRDKHHDPRLVFRLLHRPLRSCLSLVAGGHL